MLVGPSWVDYCIKLMSLCYCTWLTTENHEKWWKNQHLDAPLSLLPPLQLRYLQSSGRSSADIMEVGSSIMKDLAITSLRPQDERGHTFSLSKGYQWLFTKTMWLLWWAWPQNWLSWGRSESGLFEFMKWIFCGSITSLAVFCINVCLLFPFSYTILCSVIKCLWLLVHYCLCCFVLLWGNLEKSNTRSQVMYIVMWSKSI